MALFKKKLDESEAAALYVSHLFKLAEADWKQLAEGLEQIDDATSEVVEKAVCAEGYFALALLAQNLGGAVHYSPAFSTRRALAHRLSTWALFSLLADHRDEFLHLESEKILATYRKYEAVGLRAAKAGDDPITPIANELFIDLFGDNISAFVMKGTDEVNPLISTVFADLFMLGCTNTFNALRHVVEEFQLLETPFPPA